MAAASRTLTVATTATELILGSNRSAVVVSVHREWFNSFSYPQSPITHSRVLLPIPSATMVRDLEFSLYRLLPFQHKPFFRPRRSGRIRILPLNTLVRTLNPAGSFRLGKFRHRGLLL